MPLLFCCQFDRKVRPVCFVHFFERSFSIMAKAAVILIALMLVGYSMAQSSKAGNCPLPNTVTKCSPRCMRDFECSFNEKCCPNKCGSNSCVSPSAVSTGYDKGSRDDGVSCGGVKCRRYEKCELDRATKRQKCVRT